MSEQWQYQLRLYLADELAEAARCDAGAPVLGPLPAILDKHAATMKCQFDAFADYVAQAEAELWAWHKSSCWGAPDEGCAGKHGRSIPLADFSHPVVVHAAAPALISLLVGWWGSRTREVLTVTGRRWCYEVLNVGGAVERAPAS